MEYRPEGPATALEGYYIGRLTKARDGVGGRGRKGVYKDIKPHHMGQI